MTIPKPEVKRHLALTRNMPYLSRHQQPLHDYDRPLSTDGPALRYGATTQEMGDRTGVDALAVR
ncbi:MAG: hypothetical protein WA939_06410 [Nodosilinea sp.]